MSTATSTTYPPTVKDPNAPASEKQIEYIKSLLGSRQIDPRAVCRMQVRLANHDLTKGFASESIAWMKNQPFATPAAPAAPVVDGPGIYVGGSGKVYTAMQRKGYTTLLWKYAYVAQGMKPKLIKIYSGSAKKDIETGGHKMTEAEADEFGKKWAFKQGGKTYSFCVCCGRLLTAEESVNLGIGPICRGKTIWA